MTGLPPRHGQGAPCWVSLTVPDLTPVQEFYRALFGWEFRSGPRHFGPYVRAVLDGRPAAGLGQAPPELRLPVRWTTYLCCDNADATAELIRDCGGTVGVGPLDAELGAGRLAIAADPDGAVFGIWQPMAHPGLCTAGEPGSLARIDLVTRDTSAAGKFYAAVFGHDAEQELSERDELTLRLAGRPVAGVHGAGRDLPGGPHWLVSFAVADPVEAARQAVALGGRVVGGQDDSRAGRPATVADPAGAVFRLVRAGGWAGPWGAAPQAPAAPAHHNRRPGPNHRQA